VSAWLQVAWLVLLGAWLFTLSRIGLLAVRILQQILDELRALRIERQLRDLRKGA
jgi:hypothetical protein